MAYDEALAARIRDALADVPHLSEKKMFGGLGFLVSGNMVAAAGSHGGLMLRINPADADDLVTDHVTRMEMRGRPMNGWLTADDTATASDVELRRLLQVGLDYVQQMPPK